MYSLIIDIFIRSSMQQIVKKSYWDIIPTEIQEIILQYRSVIQIQNNAIKMFYNKYGISWKENIINYQKNYENLLDYYNFMDDYSNGSKYDFP